jgi:type I restriction enzyme R subunit
MMRVNPQRINYLNRLEELIDKHNETSANNADYPAELVELARAVSAEEQRALREQLSEEELAIADLLLSEHEPAAGEWEQVKTIARNLLAKLKSSGRMANNWYNKQEMRSGVMSIIIRDLEALPDSYSPAQYRQKVEEVYRYVRAYFENYSGGDGPLTA